MEYEINTKYPLSELSSAAKWWEDNREYDINEFEDYFTITKRDNTAYTKETIDLLKQRLLDTDYQAIKYSEGVLSEEEYAPIKAQRIEWRAKINELEATI